MDFIIRLFLILGGVMAFDFLLSGICYFNNPKSPKENKAPTLFRLSMIALFGQILSYMILTFTT